MATTNRNAAYDLSYAAEPARKRPQAPSMPKNDPLPQRSRPKPVPKQPRSSEEIWSDFVARVMHTVRVIVMCSIISGMLGMVLYEKAKLIELNSEETRYQQMLEKAESKKVSLEAQFNSLISVENVEVYARQELGMVKRQRYQTKYFMLEGSDQVVLANGEITEN